MDLGFTLTLDNPKRNANVFSRIFFGWVIPMIKRCVRHNLEIEGLYRVLEKDQSELLTDKIERYWDEEVKRAKHKKVKPSLMKVIIKQFYGESMVYGFLWFFSNVFVLCLRPIILAKLIKLFLNNGDRNIGDMYYYGLGLILTSFLSLLILHHTMFSMGAVGMRIRVALSSLLYRKIIRLNQKSLGQTASGQIVNLLSNDMVRFDLSLPVIHGIWVMPFQVVVLLFVVYSQVGIASVTGIVTMVVVTVPLQSFLTKFVGRLRESISKRTDGRVKLMSEIIAGIQVIKMYGWEKPFEKLVELSRCYEMKDITSATYLRGVYSSCMVFSDRLCLFTTIITFILIGNVISADIVFSLAQAFSLLQLAMAVFFPLALSTFVETLISIKRLESFLVMEEKEEDIIKDIKKTGVTIVDVVASWTDLGHTLDDINLKIPAGTLCAIVGPVGAGKSSLLQLILGELPATRGTVQVGGNVSYSSQEPWLFQSTVRNNILFGNLYDKKWYAKVIKVCALERDFEQFPHGDKTIVGEKGVSLSGGQRARINLARAIYRKADIYLLDDPLSAVDTHVGKHLFEQCIFQHLQGKTRILVTHQLQYLKKADLIIVMNEGLIEAQGTFQELTSCNLDFTKLLVKADETDEKKEEVPPPETTNFETTRRFSSSTEGSRKFSLTSDGGRKFSSVSGRKMSTISSASSDTLQEDDQIAEEESGEDPNSKPLWSYMSSTRNIALVSFVIFLLVGSQAVLVAIDQWLTRWTSQEQLRHSDGLIYVTPPPRPEVGGVTNSTTLRMGTAPIRYGNGTDGSSNRTSSDGGTGFFFPSIDIDDLYDFVLLNDGTVERLIKTTYAMYIYGALLILAVLFVISRTFLFAKACMLSSKNLHSMMFHKLLKAPMRFFDTNPSGRILNRFSKDIGAIDEVLPRVLLDALSIFLILAGVLVNIVISSPFMVIILVILGIVYLKFRDWYLVTARTLKHIEGIAKSPVFSHINSTLNGIVTIRASNAENVLINEFDCHQDVHTSAWYYTIASMNAFGFWLDLIVMVLLAVVTFSFVIWDTVSTVDGSIAGLAISQCMVLTGVLQFGTKQLAEVINNLTSVDRVLQYTKIDNEGPFETPRDKRPKGTWPRRGNIEFKGLCLRYIADDPPVLKDLNFVIRPGEKVGIVGRTGAGKSSLISALFRLAPLEGSILIDRVEIQNLGLTDLRKKISIIPQEPVLFSETLRYNLDPFGEFDDDKIWDALELVELKESVDSLDFMVAEGGANFSLGQRQLICLARAILKDNKILILDEATANVDQRTDSLIQATIRKAFKDCTVLTIAHRLNTIMDSDKVLVMSFGNMVEFDHPHNLLQIEDGYFHKMVMETSPGMAEELKKVAKKAYEKRVAEEDN
ncbi:ATP-binding cassette sub-family C member 4-like [Diorhabda carinulata]|uniref:ATP-binding cassette sub-family C member 4-like n=1 Tax=Diorhabda carinulata TaxID=1163345 RepID=UPI0025A08F16|nr:ATP-binding cassette sub-family C member 4-like [Diorhabda carinulata]